MKTTAEITENQLKHILNNDNYKKLKSFDFLEYDEILRKLKRHLFDCEKDFKNYKKGMIEGIYSGTYDKPEININDVGEWECVDGEIRLLTLKLLGIDPVIDLSISDYTSITIINQRLVFNINTP
jgi:hypothetical protein